MAPIVSPIEMGGRLRAVRNRCGLTLREAASAAGLSPSFVGMVERGVAEIAVSRLSRLAEVYGISVASLLESPHPPGVELVRRGEVHGVTQTAKGVVSDFLGSPYWVMQPFRVALQPKSCILDLVHPGDEFYFCVEGDVRITVAGSGYEIAAGDLLIVPAHTGHGLENLGEVVAILIGAEVEADTASRRLEETTSSAAAPEYSLH